MAYEKGNTLKGMKSKDYMNNRNGGLTDKDRLDLYYKGKSLKGKQPTSRQMNKRKSSKITLSELPWN
jgi:hypothetical protein